MLPFAHIADVFLHQLDVLLVTTRELHLSLTTDVHGADMQCTLSTQKWRIWKMNTGKQTKKREDLLMVGFLYGFMQQFLASLY